MAEVSSCVFDNKIRQGAKIKKGEEIGQFQFGGSTHAVIFRKGAIKELIPDPSEPSLVRLSSLLAIANESLADKPKD